MNQRLEATMDRLVSNIPAACKVLKEQGYHNLAGQLQRDQENLVYWLENPHSREEREEFLQAP